MDYPHLAFPTKPFFRHIIDPELGSCGYAMFDEDHAGRRHFRDIDWVLVSDP